MYQQMQTVQGLEFEFFLAAKLGMTVGQLRAQMGHAEFVAWGVYYARKAQREEMAQRKAKSQGRKRR